MRFSEALIIRSAISGGVRQGGVDWKGRGSQRVNRGYSFSNNAGSGKWIIRWWLNQPIWKICDSQIGSFPRGSGWKFRKKKHQLDENGPFWTVNLIFQGRIKFHFYDYGRIFLLSKSFGEFCGESVGKIRDFSPSPPNPIWTKVCITKKDGWKRSVFRTCSMWCIANHTQRDM